MRAFNSGAGENIMEWCLSASSLRQISSVKVEPDGLGRRAVLKMDHSFFQWLGTFGRNFVTEESDLGCFKDIFRWVDLDLTLLEPVEESS
jgi:hypothetical protein